MENKYEAFLKGKVASIQKKKDEVKARRKEKLADQEVQLQKIIAERRAQMDKKVAVEDEQIKALDKELALYNGIIKDVEAGKSPEVETPKPLHWKQKAALANA